MNNPKPSFAIDSIVSFGIIPFFLAFVACTHHRPTATASLSIFAALINSCSPTQTSIPAIDPADIVFDRNTTGSFEIYRRASNDGSVSQITNSPGYDSWWPRISPDRTKILFYRALTSNNKDYSKADLFMVNADGTRPIVIRTMGRDGWVFQAHAEWSPDGNEIVMSGATGSGVNSGILQIFVTDSDGVIKRQITNTPAVTWNCDPSWSPDGQTIVYNHYDSGDATNLEIYTIPSSGMGHLFV